MRIVAALCLLLTACGPGDMAEQRRIDPFEDHGALVPPVGTVARNGLARGVGLAVQPATGPALVARGGDRFAIFCAPCHGARGDGDGRVPSIPAPPDLLRSHRDAESMVAIITGGIGAMPSLGDRLNPRDRWAVAAYVERLRSGAPR